MRFLSELLISLRTEEDDQATNEEIKQLFKKILNIYELAKLQNSDRFSFFRDELIKSDELEVFNDRINIGKINDFHRREDP